MQRRSPWPYLGAALAMVAAFLATQTRLGTDPRRSGERRAIRDLAARSDLNLLFILIDTLRADRVSCYGYARDTSPTLDALAASGIRFAAHQSQSSWTKTSMASLWTSLYPARAGVLHATDVVSPEAQLPAEILRERGFRTAGLWRNGWVAPNFGFDQGFEAYTAPRPGPPRPGQRSENIGARLPGSDFDIVASGEEFLRTRDRERWFLYVHLMDLHQYATDEHSARFGSTYSDAYDNAIHFSDRAVAALLAMLDARGLRERTVVVLVSDHGEAFGEHGSEGHARNVYGEVIRTPWILSLPFRLEPGIVVEGLSENVDVWPTLLDLLGLPARAQSDGRSRVPEILGVGVAAGATAHATSVAHLDRGWARRGLQPLPAVAVTRLPLRLIRQAGAIELYDLAADAREQRNLAAEQPALARDLAAVADAYLREQPIWSGGTPQVELDDLQLGQLRALGYAVEK